MKKSTKNPALIICAFALFCLTFAIVAFTQFLSLNKAQANLNELKSAVATINQEITTATQQLETISTPTAQALSARKQGYATPGETRYFSN